MRLRMCTPCFTATVPRLPAPTLAPGPELDRANNSVQLVVSSVVASMHLSVLTQHAFVSAGPYLDTLCEPHCLFSPMRFLWCFTPLPCMTQPRDSGSHILRCANFGFSLHGAFRV
ncbi:hypothetical protein SCLCIDRAFT_1208119 [Scleroderma citrinum Foug A]|uniref:Uncharacterized protein n=1 Tax=Scleroderma citrinum Foug A TaxID=1036808 RepID=A0A0C3EN91_9AGAM|nr:hypothetical protein SCLCIDRAFT_1208119 [Scleroderma citrinum Foug A]